jgi:hypothetical protein
MATRAQQQTDYAPGADARAAHIARALHVKRVNAVAALLTGGAVIWFATFRQQMGVSSLTIALGFVAGLVYANGFEYVLHRYLLHWGNGFLVQRHALHHDSAGAVNEARYVNFATSPLVVVFVIFLNAPVALVAGRFIHHGLAPGMLAGFTAYLIAYEEIHWRFHLGGWLPRWMNFARRHHMLHHGDFKGRYNVFFPLFDWLLERHEWKRNVHQTASRPPER